MCVNCENEWVPRVQVINPIISQSIPDNRSAKLQLTKSTYPTLNLTKLLLKPLNAIRQIKIKLYTLI